MMKLGSMLLLMSVLLPAASSADVLHMKNGSVFKGTVLGKSFGVYTNYAGKVTIPRRYLGKIYMEGERKNVETLITVTGGAFQWLFDRASI